MVTTVQPYNDGSKQREVQLIFRTADHKAGKTQEALRRRQSSYREEGRRREDRHGRNRHPVARLPPSERCYTALSNRPMRFPRSKEHTSELQSLRHLVCRLLLEKKK